MIGNQQDGEAVTVEAVFIDATERLHVRVARRRGTQRRAARGSLCLRYQRYGTEQPDSRHDPAIHRTRNAHAHPRSMSKPAILIVMAPDGDFAWSLCKKARSRRRALGSGPSTL